MELNTIGDRKTALFVIISDTDDTFNFVVSILYTQLFNLLCDKADDVYGGRLPVHVRCLLDEFANIGQMGGQNTEVGTRFLCLLCYESFIPCSLLRKKAYFAKRAQRKNAAILVKGCNAYSRLFSFCGQIICPRFLLQQLPLPLRLQSVFPYCSYRQAGYQAAAVG